MRIIYFNIFMEIPKNGKCWSNKFGGVTWIMLLKRTRDIDVMVLWCCFYSFNIKAIDIYIYPFFALKWLKWHQHYDMTLIALAPNVIVLCWCRGVIFWLNDFLDSLVHHPGMHVYAAALCICFLFSPCRSNEF